MRPKIQNQAMWLQSQCSKLLHCIAIHSRTDKEDVVYIYRMEYYSAIKKNEILPFAATCMDLESIMHSEISQTEKDKYSMLSLTCGI